MRRVTYPISLVLLTALLAHGSDSPKKSEKKEEPVVWHDHVVPGPAVSLQLQRNVGKALFYEGTLARTQTSENSYRETDTFYLTVLCADKEDVQGKKTLDLLAMRREFTDRQRTETLANKKQMKKILPNTDEIIELGPNGKKVGDLRCYGYYASNFPVYRTEDLLLMKDGREVPGTLISDDGEKVSFLSSEDKLDLKRSEIEAISRTPVPHVCLGEAPHYLFPIFSERKVSPGDAWRFKVPLIIPVEAGWPAKVLPTQFEATLNGRLREVRQQKNGTTIATVDYQVAGEFDSLAPENSKRFPDEFNAVNHIVRAIKGSGTALVDVDNGWIVEKSETFTVALYSMALIAAEPGKKALKDEHVAEITSRYDIKLIPPGTRLPSGKAVPDAK